MHHCQHLIPNTCKSLILFYTISCFIWEYKPDKIKREVQSNTPTVPTVVVQKFQIFQYSMNQLKVHGSVRVGTLGLMEMGNGGYFFESLMEMGNGGFFLKTK